jgi:hypothetical protein
MYWSVSDCDSLVQPVIRTQQINPRLSRPLHFVHSDNAPLAVTFGQSLDLRYTRIGMPQSQLLCDSSTRSEFSCDTTY